MKSPSLKTFPTILTLLLSIAVINFTFSQEFSLETNSSDKPVSLESVNIETEILGSFAITTTEMVFHNPNNRLLEGQLKFPLLDEQSVIRFAMDVNGNLREAVPVEKNKGQTVFEAIERRRIDPGLLEKTEGNNYRARIYPINPKSYKRVIIATFENLASESNHSRYRLPMNYGTVKDFKIKLSVKGPDVNPTIRLDGLKGLELSNWHSDLVSEGTATNFEAVGLLELAIPPISSTKAFIQDLGGKTYFYAPVQFDPGKPSLRSPPKDITLFWDSSSSGSKRNLVKEFELLNNWFTKNKNIEVNLIRFRNEAELPIIFSIENGNWSKLKTELEQTIYDGGTDLSFLAHPIKSELAILFSDGMVNLNSANSIATQCPIVVAQSAISSNSNLLKSIANQTGGVYIDLVKTETDLASDKILENTNTLQSLTYNPNEVAFVYPKQGTVLDSHFGISGILRKPEAQIQLRIKTGNGESVDVSIQVSSKSIESEWVSRAWANEKIHLLESQFETNKEEIRSIGSAFGIVTQGTSLIILDTVQDYVTYEIRPPADLIDEYERLTDLQNRNRLKRNNDKIASVLRMFSAHVKWYEKDWPKDQPKLKPIKREAVRSDNGAPRDRILANVAPPTPDAITEEALFAAEDIEESGLHERSTITGTPINSETLMRDDSGKGASNHQTTIQLQPWKPDSAYAEHLRRVEPQECYLAYLEEKPDYTNSTSFYLDCFDILIEKQQDELALRVLSNLAEMDLENHSILRILAYRLLQMGEYDLAIHIFEKVLSIREEEPQSYRDLAWANYHAGNFQQAIDLLWKIIEKPWDGRFPEIELIALTELNMIASLEGEKLDITGIDQRLLKDMPIDLRVVLSWDADNTDIDLWITDPNGEKCFYSHPLTYQGGKMSRDFTQGYGPEVFMIKDAKPGTYKVEANYYGNSQQIISGSTTLQMNLQKNFGSKSMEEKTVTLRLKDKQKVVFVGSFTVE